MSATHYRSSKGLKLIADLPYPYLCNALAKLERDGYNEDRDEEVAAMRSRKAELEAQQTDEHDARTDAQAEAAETPAPIGHNMPPEPTEAAEPAAADPFGALQVHFDDLYTESKNWADGQAVENDAQAEEVDRLIQAWKDAITAAEKVRDEEIAPLTAKVAEVRERFYPLIGDTKKVVGIAIRAKKALLDVKTAWGRKKQAALDAEAKRLRDEALAKAKEAAGAAKAAAGDLEAMESVEDLIQSAKADLKAANQAAKATPGRGYRTATEVVMVDKVVAVRTMWQRHPDAFLDLALTLAQRDAREGLRALAGFTITEVKVAA